MPVKRITIISIHDLRVGDKIVDDFRIDNAIRGWIVERRELVATERWGNVYPDTGVRWHDTRQDADIAASGLRVCLLHEILHDGVQHSIEVVK